MELIKTPENQMMSSKRIAEKTGKTHSNVLRDIRNMIDELHFQNSNLNPSEYQELMAANSMTSEILLNERLSLCLASGYSIALRMMIIDDWAEMKKPKELSRKEILLIALEAEERAEIAEAKIKVLEPKAEFYDTVANTDTTFDFAQAAKMMGLKFGNVTLFSKLRDRKILDKWNIPYQKYISAGYFELKQKTYIMKTGTRVHSQARVTEKGLKWLIQNKQQLS